MAERETGGDWERLGLRDECDKHRVWSYTVYLPQILAT